MIVSQISDRRIVISPENATESQMLDEWSHHRPVVEQTQKNFEGSVTGLTIDWSHE